VVNAPPTSTTVKMTAATAATDSVIHTRALRHAERHDPINAERGERQTERAKGEHERRAPER